MLNINNWDIKKIFEDFFYFFFKLKIIRIIVIYFKLKNLA